MERKQRILFLCTGNTCRSQMAEAWVRHLWGDRFDVFSAGVLPGRMDPRAVFVMEEVGVSMTGSHPKPLDTLRGISFDLVVTVCDRAREACPYFANARRLIHRGFEDPPLLAREAKTEEEALAPYRRVREEIRQFILQLPWALEK